MYATPILPVRKAEKKKWQLVHDLRAINEVDFLAEVPNRGGHKASLTKLQYCQPKIEYMGRIIAQGTKALAPSQLEGINKAPQPQTIRQMFTCLTRLSSDWVENTEFRPIVKLI